MKLSVNTFIKKEPKKGSNAWEGENLTADAPGSGDLYSGVAPGLGEAGGIAHFKNRTTPTAKHK